MTEDRLSIEVLHIDGVEVMTVFGEIDLHSVPLLRAALEELSGEQDLVVDCAGLDFIDSTGLNLLVTQAKRFARAGGSLRLRHASPAVQRILKLSGLIGLIESTGSRQPWPPLASLKTSSR